MSARGTRVPRDTLRHRRRAHGDATYQKLRQAIFDGRFAPGARLLEQDLATQLGVSRTPVREALRRLVAEGLVVPAPLRGFVVAALEPELILDAYVVREALESLAARLAASNVSELDLLQLKDSFERMRRVAAKGSIGELVERTGHFERLVAKASRNRFLNEMLGALRDRLRLLRDPNFRVPGRKEAALEELGRVLDAIERRDPDAAEAEMRAHVRNARQVRLRMLGHESR